MPPHRRPTLQARLGELAQLVRVARFLACLVCVVDVGAFAWRVASGVPGGDSSVVCAAETAWTVEVALATALFVASCRPAARHETPDLMPGLGWMLAKVCFVNFDHCRCEGSGAALSGRVCEMIHGTIALVSVSNRQCTQFDSDVPRG